jgi:hypothetical protein
MPLDKTALRDALKAAFQQGLADPDWTQDDAAQALADAIDAYVRAAQVVGISVNVVDAGNVQIGTGTQVGTGSLQ